MEDGSDEHKAGLEAMGKKKGITPSGSAANLHQAREVKAPQMRNTEAQGKPGG